MTATDPTDRPYVGLRPYGRDDRPLFHGRDLESREIATLWRAAGLTVLYGASGVGKTSLLNAGVLPRIDAMQADVLPVVRISPHAPIEGGNPYVMALLSAWAPDAGPSALAGTSITDFLAARPDRKDEYGDPLPVLAAIDQAEAMFHSDLAHERDRKDFVDQLVRAMHDHACLHLLLSLREEFLFLVLPYERPFGQGSRARFHLQPLTPQAATDAVEKPLAHTSRTITRAATTLLLDELRSAPVTEASGDVSLYHLDTVEPVQLQVVCSALWDSLPGEVTVIDEEHVRAYAKVEEFLFEFCKRAVTRVAAEFGIPAGEILLWLRRTFITDHGTRNTAYEGLEKTKGMPNGVARALEDRHVLRGEHRMGSRWYELAHDRLIGPVSHRGSPDTYLDAARVARAQRNWPLAGQLADEAWRAADPDDTGVRAEVAEIYAEAAFARGDVKAVRRYCDEAAALYAERGRFDGVARVLTIDGRWYLANGDITRAIEQINTAVTLAPNDISAQMALAEAFSRAGTPQAAAAVVNAVFGQLPDEAVEQANEMLRLPE
jgi:tetratricopeptide (TPR) repeat protein